MSDAEDRPEPSEPERTPDGPSWVDRRVEQGEPTRRWPSTHRRPIIVIGVLVLLAVLLIADGVRRIAQGEGPPASSEMHASQLVADDGLGAFAARID